MFIQAMIGSDDFLSAAAAHLDTSLLESPHLRLIADWCLEYHGVHHKAPSKDIEPIYYTWYEKQDEETKESKAISGLLASLSDDYSQAGEINVQYLLDELAQYMTMRKLHSLRDDLDTQLFRGEVTEAVMAVNDFRASTIGRGAGIDPLGDDDVWGRAFAETADPIITMPGAAGRFFQSALTRESLIAIQAPEKRGKTWWCIELIWRALRQKRKVAFFQVGDLSEGQGLGRLAVRISQQPMFQRDCGKILVPKKIVATKAADGKGEDIKVVYEDVQNYPLPICESSTIAATKLIRAGYRKRNGEIPTPRLMLSVHPTSSVTVKDIDAILTGWEVERDYVPDVIVVDYADILAPEDARRDSRDQINDTWASLRRLSQERRCLVIVPTQANAAAYSARTQSMKHFSNDKRKMAHVTGMIGLNQDEDEKSKGIMRLNWIVLREAPFSSHDCLTVAQCLTLGRAMCCSYLPGFQRE